MFIPVSRYVKVIKIYQDFPELRLQMYCHLFYGSQCIYVSLWVCGKARCLMLVVIVIVGVVTCYSMLQKASENKTSGTETGLEYSKRVE